MHQYIIFILLTLSFSAHTTENKNATLQSFINNAENCQHLASEWDSTLPQVQQRDIEKQIDIVCPTARQLREVIKRRYQDDKKTMSIIESYDF